MAQAPFVRGRDVDDQLARTVCQGTKKDVEAALATGASVDGTDYPPLIFAVKRKDMGIVKLLIKKGANVSAPVVKDVFDPDGQGTIVEGGMAIHVAATLGLVDMVILLIQHGASPNAASLKG